MDNAPDTEPPLRVLFIHSNREDPARVARALGVVAEILGDAQVVCPTDEAWRDLIDAHGHEGAYRRMVGAADAVVALEHAGHVGRGLHTMLSLALAADKAAWVVRRSRVTGHPHLSPVVGLDLTGTDDWAVEYATVRVLRERPAAAPRAA